MKRTEDLPEGYRELLAIDLQQDKKLSLLVNGGALLLMAVLGIGMHFVVPITTLFEGADSPFAAMLKPLVAFGIYIAYIFLHEAVHGVAMRICGTKKIKYGFTGLYAFAGSDDYYGKRAYIFIALAPVVFWGVVLGVVAALVPTEWFWVVWFVQIGNLSGAMGDFYVTVKFSTLPADLLVRDSGVAMKVYSAAESDRDLV